jgi:hypothetical protein
MTNAIERIHKEILVSRLTPYPFDESSNSTELDTEDGEVHKEQQVTGEDEEEEAGRRDSFK